MINFESFITRLDEESLQEIIGKEAISILNTMDSNLSRLYNLQTVILNLFSPFELIKKKKTRDILINILKKEEAENLATLFTNVSVNNPFEFLIKYRYKDENDFQNFFSFFQLPPREIIAKKEFIDEFSIIPQYPLFDYQRNAINEINNYLFHKDKRVLLHMPTGSGKTRTAMNIICSLLIKKEPGTILWFANTEELCEQAVSEFEKAWTCLGNREIKTYRYWGSSDLDITKLKDGFIVAGLAKTYNLLEKNSSAIGKVAGNCSLVIMDEAHMAIAKTYKLILDTFTVFNASLLGLSATPGRTWNNPVADEELAIFFKKNKVTLKIEGYDNPVDYLVKEGYLAKITNSPLLYNGGITISERDIEYLNSYLQLPESFLKNLSEDKQRNILIIRKVEELILKHKRIILFALNVAHSDLIAIILQGRGINAFSLTNQTENQQRNSIIKHFKSESADSIVLCNYGILTTGFDAPKTSCALIARPTDSLVLYSQMVGRAIRGIKAGGNLDAEIVTVVDTCLPGFDKINNAFFNWEDVWE